MVSQRLIMIKKCKNVDITSKGLIYHAVLACLRPLKKRKRYDTVKMFANVLKISKTRAAEILIFKDEEYYEGVKIIAGLLRKALITGNLNLKSPREMLRADVHNGKLRKITVLNIWHLLLDHVAVIGLKELYKSIGEYQVSSIPKRGRTYGDKAIRKWIYKLRNKKVYFAKLDIKNFYGSVDKEILFKWLGHHVANPKLLWLIRNLMSVLENGMAIGSYLSQALANIYLSVVYHRVKEYYHIIRRGNRIPVFKHALFYMDDMLLIGTNKRAMKKSIKDLKLFILSKLHLIVKPTWRVMEVSKRYPIDIMGYRYTMDGTVTLRRRIYKYVRRIMLRANRKKYIAPKAACRIMSYKGYTKGTMSIPKNINPFNIYKRASKVISNYYEQKSTLY